MNAAEKKRCPCCKCFKPLYEFKSPRYGRLNTTCRDCISLATKRLKPQDDTKPRKPDEVYARGDMFIRVFYNNC